MEATLTYPLLKLVVTDSAIPNFSLKNQILRISYNLLKADATYATLGETIASLLLYPPLESSEVWSDLEKLVEYYTKKTVRNSLSELVRAYEPLTPEIRITPLYPLVRKAEIVDGLLSKLYVNMEADIREKSRVEKEYEDFLSRVDGLSFTNGFYKIDNPSRLASKSMTVTTIPSTDIKRTMAAGIMKRIRSEVKGPDLRITRSHAFIDSTKIGVKCGKPEEMVKDYLQCKGGIKCTQGHFISSSVLCECNGGKLVVKDYGKMGGKWVILKIMAKPMIEYRISPRARMIAEYTAMKEMTGIKSVRTPFFHELCSTQGQRAIAVRDYLEGTILRETSESNNWTKAGETLGMLHNHGVTLGDANPGNFILTPCNEVGIIDAEQSHDYSLKTAAWDIVTFVSTSLFWRVNQKLITRFLEGYMQEAHNPMNVLEEASKEYTWIGILPTVPHIYVQSKRILDQLMNENPMRE
ncbi:MAG: hypothetical protein F7B59_03175 [Desulfurococcales archaeon]|nr:hypothetical protein [Desulfurococcales archaeon]